MPNEQDIETKHYTTPPYDSANANAYSEGWKKGYSVAREIAKEDMDRVLDRLIHECDARLKLVEALRDIGEAYHYASNHPWHWEECPNERCVKAR